MAALVEAEVARTLAKCGGLGEVATRLQLAQVKGGQLARWRVRCLVKRAGVPEIGCKHGAAVPQPFPCRPYGQRRPVAGYARPPAGAMSFTPGATCQQPHSTTGPVP